MLIPNPESVRCSSCNGSMRLAYVVPRLGGLPELHAYQCKTCGAIVTRFAGEQIDGATTGETASALVPEGRDISG